MDVFKLLSRSSKAPQASPTQKLPSSGAAANPQLFGRDENEDSTEASRKSRKRKRGQAATESEGTLPAELDFFSGASVKAHRSHEAKVGHTKRNEAEAHGEEDLALEDLDSGNGSEELDEDERKRILRLHKLKITILEDFAPEKEGPRKRKNKSKKRRHEEDETAHKDKKKEKKSLFPQPLTSFAQLRSRYGISRRLAENLMEQGYKVPTEVQLGALPLLLKERRRSEQASGTSQADDTSDADIAGDIDLLTVAPTGSGKTVAFLIPIINALLAEKDETKSNQGPQAVVIAPTRELAAQIVNEARKLGKGTGIKAALMKKGMEVVKRPAAEELKDAEDASEASDEVSDNTSSFDDDNQAPKRKRQRADIVKASILVATPLALLNALKLGDELSSLPSIRHLVLDEADVLLDPLFREQTHSVWNACTNPHLRIGLWSATMGSNIESLAISNLNARWASLPTTPSLPPRQPLVRLVVGLKDTAIPNITHKLIYAATEQGKLLGLRQLLHPSSAPASSTTNLLPPFLIFTQTIPRAIALHSELLYDIPLEAGGSSRIAVLHADLSSSAREAIMTRFRRGEIWILITTDLLARGVDFRGLNGVVNYDVPNSAAAYVHRVGRTGRAGREGGVAVTFYTEEDIPYVKNVANVIRASEKLRGGAGKDGGKNGGGGEKEEGIQQWLLDALPTPSKRDKQRLKKRGVEARRNVKGGDGKGNMRISTKSGWERKKEANLRGAKSANRRRERGDDDAGPLSESEFEGFGA